MTDNEFKKGEEKYEKIIRRELPEYKEEPDTGHKNSHDSGHRDDNGNGKSSRVHWGR